jgi:hypothetical protein
MVYLGAAVALLVALLREAPDEAADEAAGGSLVQAPPLVEPSAH